MLPNRHTQAIRGFVTLAFGHTCWLVLGLTLGSLSIAHAQVAPSATPPKNYMSKNVFYLPILIDDRVRAELREVQLYVKDNPAQPWVLKDKAPPSQTSFTFRAPQDGEYWFTVVTVDRQGRAAPPDVSREGPGQIVVLDTQPPQVDLQPLPATPEGQPVTCQVRDHHLDSGRTKFFYQTGDKVWRPLDPLPGKVDQFCIPVQAVFTGMVRVTAGDMAGNVTNREYNLATVQTAASPGPANQPPAVEMPLPPAVMSQPPTVVSQTPSIPPIQVPVVDQPPPKDPVPASGPSLAERVQVVVNRQPSTPPPAAEPTPELQPMSPMPPQVVAPPSGNPTPLQVLTHQPVVNIPKPPPAPPSLMIPPPGTSQLLAPPSAPTAQPTVPLPSRVETAVLNRQVVSNARLSLEYQIEQAGASGVGKVEIWVTRDRGQSWQRLCEDADRHSPVEVDLPGEGLFGLSLVASNGRGFGGNPPTTGDQPDWWIEVDLTKPAAELLSVRPVSDEDGSALLINWMARDKNLGRDPIDLFYAPSREGPWRPIAKGLGNLSQYRWTVPTEAGARAFIRLVVHDQGGNQAIVETPQPILLDDLSRPRVRVTGVNVTGPKLTPVLGGN